MNSSCDWGGGGKESPTYGQALTYDRDELVMLVLDLHYVLLAGVMVGYNPLDGFDCGSNSGSHHFWQNPFNVRYDVSLNVIGRYEVR